MTFVPFPARIRSADDVLAVARGLVDAATDRIEADPDMEVSCRAGCAACCSQAVPVTPAEVRAIVAHIDGMPIGQASAVRQRIADASRRLRALGFRPASLQDTTDPDSLKAAASRYFEAAVACPLLDDDRCSVRPVRPLICREYLVTSDPAHCGELGREQIVRIRPRRSVPAGFSRVSTAFGETDVLTLALALADEVAAPPRSGPKSGASAVRMLTSEPAGA